MRLLKVKFIVLKIITYNEMWNLGMMRDEI